MWFDVMEWYDGLGESFGAYCKNFEVVRFIHGCVSCTPLPSTSVGLTNVYSHFGSSSGSSSRVRGGPRNMKSMQLPSAAIFFMTYFHRARGTMAPSPPPPGSATGLYWECILFI